ncbi:hypothetical protein ACLQ27_14520 [Micromonospora sp. DT63]
MEILGLVRRLRVGTRGLGRVQVAAVELDDFVTSYRDSPALLLAVARAFVAVLDEADVPHDRLCQIESLVEALAAHLGAALAVEERVAPQPPKWLDVASPAHGHVNVSGVLTAFSKGHVTTADSATVVTANNCTLEAEDHYHVRRVSLDCRSLYEDTKAMAAFVRAMHDPSPDNTAQLLARLEGIIGPRRPVGPQQYRHRLPAAVATHTARAAVVAMGTGSTAHTETNYHIRETVVPLAELLLLRPDLIAALAVRRDGDTLAGPLLAALGTVEDPVLLRNARSLPSVGTSVSHSLGGTRVRLASAVMVGYGNTLTATSTVKRGQLGHTNLNRFDRTLAKSSKAQRERAKLHSPQTAPFPRRASMPDDFSRGRGPQPCQPDKGPKRRPRPSGPGPI